MKSESDFIVPVEEYVPDIVSQAMSAKWSKGSSGPAGDEVANLVAHTAFSFKPSHYTRGKDGAPAEAFPPLSADADKGDQDALVCAPIAFNARQDPIFSDTALPLDQDGTTQAIAFDSKASGRSGFGVGEVSPTLRAMNADGGHQNGGGQVAMAFQQRFRGDDGRGYGRAPPVSEEVCGTLETIKMWNVATAWEVRRLTPTECEALQGFKAGYTNVPWRGQPGAPDGPRYRILGNSMSVNVMRWLGRRIEMVEEIFAETAK